MLLSGSSPFKSANRSNLRLAGTEQIVLRGIDMMKWGWVDKKLVAIYPCCFNFASMCKKLIIVVLQKLYIGCVV